MTPLQADRIVREIDDEIARLTVARDALAGSRYAADTAKAKRGRPKGSGPRAEQVHVQLRAYPGQTTQSLAERLEIRPNYLYRLLPAMEQAGRARKEGRLWYAVDDGQVVR